MLQKDETVHRGRFARKYNQLFFDAFRISLTDPRKGTFWLRTLLRQKRMAIRRRKIETNGLMIPPVLIYSTTNRCNLRCKGCYASMRGGQAVNELPLNRVRTLFREASDLGVGVVMIAGGEPLMRPEILEAAGQQDQIIFPVFTNGTLLNGGRASFFKKYRNLIPVLSIEGSRYHTDARRGTGVYASLEKSMTQLMKSRQMFGMSITLTRENFDEVTHPVWMYENHAMGCNLFFMVEYVPQSHADTHLCLTDTQKEVLQWRLERLRKQIPALFISLPGDEERYGGCLAAGRGFVHISSNGNIEPCPFAPYSDMNIRDIGLKDALESSFLRMIRQSHHLLKESHGGCTLWENREWVQGQLERTMARPA